MAAGAPVGDKLFHQADIWLEQPKNAYASECARQSDVYVFCLLNHKEQDTINPLDTAQWRFFVLPTSILNAKAGKQKTIALSGVIKLGAKETDFAGLRNAILAAAIVQ